MQVKKIKFKDTGYFSSLILDYLEQEGKLQPFYEFPPTIEGIGEAIQNKNFPAGRREVLVNSLKQQYAGSKLSAKNAGETFKNMELLGNENTFTITTGHQLCRHQDHQHADGGTELVGEVVDDRAELLLVDRVVDEGEVQRERLVEPGRPLLAIDAVEGRVLRDEQQLALQQQPGGGERAWLGGPFW